MRTTSTMILWLAFVGVALAGDGAPTRWDFEDAPLEKLPAGWTAAKTGTGPGSVWKTVEDKSAPKGSRVLAQTSADGANSLFNLCLASEIKRVDLDLSVSFKAVAGEQDQGGGLVWRYQDAANYYIARMNPLENNFRVYRVAGGKRKQLATAEVEAAAGQWHTLRVTQQGDHIRCYLNGKLHLESHDDTFRDAGQIGLWTKADAVTYFDDLQVAPFPAGSASSAPTPAGPRRILVVNTGEGTVSLVDLTAMKEIQRYPVGPRPYGIAVSRDGKTVAVGVEDEECVKFFSLPDFKLQGKTPVGKMFNDHIVLTPDGQHILVANFYSDDVLAIDIATRQEAFRITGCSAPHVVKFGPLKQFAYVTCKKITGIAIIDPASRKLVKFMPLNVNPRSLTFSPDEKKVFFGSFWVNGFFELDTESGKVTRLLSFDPPPDSAGNQEVTYHGVEALTDTIVAAANEGRSYVDAVDVASGQRLGRLTDVVKPCCVERISGSPAGGVRFLISNLGDGTLQLAELSVDGKLKSLGKAQVGKAPKRIAFLP